MMKKNKIYQITMIIVFTVILNNVYSQGDDLITDNRDGLLTDNRDGQVYKTVIIGNQTWMAENLKFETERESICYDSSSSNCEKYGKLYNYLKAKKSCPEGWHIPSDMEWDELAEFISKDKNTGSKTAGGDWQEIGQFLKSTSGWKENGNGTDDYGFNALPGGSSHKFKYFNTIGERAYFWSSSYHLNNSVYYRYIFNSRSELFRAQDNVYSAGYSVRCLKD